MADDLFAEVDVEVLDDGDVDLTGSGVVVEVARNQDGSWRFWNVRIGDQRFGGNAPLPAPVTEALEAEYRDQMEARRA